MKNQSTDPLPDPLLEQELSVLRDMPARDPQAARRGRDRFMAELSTLEPAPVLHANPLSSIWNTIRSYATSPLKPGFALTPLIAILLAVAILLASAGTTVYASQSSQPDQPLYPVKVWSEDIRLQLASDQQARMQLDQEFAGRRVDEAIVLAQSGRAAGAGVTNRLQALVDDALQNATLLNTDGARNALENLTANLERHKTQLEKLKEHADPHAVAEFTRLVAILELKQELAAQGKKDPRALHELLKEMKSNDPGQSGNPNNSQGKGNPFGLTKTVTPGENGNGKANPNGEPALKLTRTPDPPDNAKGKGSGG